VIGTLRVKKRAHRVRVDATDAAGLTGSRTARVAGCRWCST